MFKTLIATLCISVALVAVSNAQSSPTATTGSPYVLQKQVIAGGGGTMTSATYTVSSTITQPAAGIQESAPGYVAFVGFWVPDPLSPTAGLATISGRVVTQTGQGISLSRLTLTDMEGHGVSIRPSSMGYFRFENVESGRSYVLSIASKQYSFAPQAILIDVGADVTDVIFTALQ